MENLNENRRKIKTSNIGTSCALVIFNCLIWIFFGLVFMLFGGLEFLFTAFLGDNAALILFLLGFVCALSPLYLMFIKKKQLRFLISYSIIAVFVLFLIIFSVIAANFFKDFTKEKWLEYPQVRNWMLDDLRDNHGLTGMYEDEVIELLGAPDWKNDTVFTYYMLKENRTSVFIEVTFQDGKVISAKLVNMQ